MALNADEKKLLAELMERDKAPEDDENFEVEIYDTTKGRGARVPYKQAKGWLHETLGLGQAPPESAPAGEGGPAGAGQGEDPKPDSGPAGGGYFGRKG